MANKKKEEEPKRIEAEVKAGVFGLEESEKICKMVVADADLAKEVMIEWKERREKDLQQYNAEKPSVIENLTKMGWQSDRNLGLCPAVCDIYQATLLQTCWNPDSIHFKATEVNDIDNKDNLERFTKWGLGQHEADFEPECDDFINNRVVQGTSFFKIYWEITHDWVDERIPVYSKGKTRRVIKYRKKTVRKKFERGVIKNIDSLDDILIPNFGKKIQDLKFLIEVQHYTFDDLMDMKDRKVVKNVNEKLRDKLKQAVFDSKKASLRQEDAENLGLEDITDEDIRTYPVDCYEWYGKYKKDGKFERYRFRVEPTTMTLLSGSPLRKISRSGKYPYTGGAFIRRPGFIKGKSLPHLVEPVVNAFNNTYNQTSDFQYVENCPFGFFNPDEGYSKQEYTLFPGKMFPTGENPKENHYFPNLSRNLAWSYNDLNMLLQILERLTGAASYFLTSSQKQSTATRDMLVEEKGETKFGLWVRRIMRDICEAINMWVQLYQDLAPPKLGERVLGEDGKKLFKNLSIDSLRGGYDVYKAPDLTSGSKAYDRKLKMWGLEVLSQTVWLDPQINPRGNWLIVADAAKAAGYSDPERYLGPQPKQEIGSGKEVENEWYRFMQGEEFDPPEGENVLEHLIGHMQQKEEKYYELDESYRPHFDAHLFKTQVGFKEFMFKRAVEQMSNQVAMRAIGGVNGAFEGPPGGSPARIPAKPESELPGAENVPGRQGSQETVL